MKKPNSYPALRMIAGIYNILAILVAIGAVGGIVFGITLLNSYGRGNDELGITIILISVFGGFLYIITLMAIAELIKLFISLEGNTYKTNTLIEKLVEEKKP